MTATRTGIDRIARGDAAACARVRGRTIGLVAHPASVASDLRHAGDVLRAAGARIAAYFGPEHGFGGEAQDMIGVVGAAKAPDGAPIHSLYGDSPESLSPRREWLEGLDALVIDLADVGSRYYTFVWTAALAMEAAHAAGLETIVLDRPNPLGGVRMEGAPQREGFRSFVGLWDVPVRHAMTIGEIVTMVAALRGIDAGVSVVAMEGWDATRGFEATQLPWVLPSPNMPTLDTARVYPGGCLLEGTNLSEGRGCTRPFEIFGAPWLDARAIAASVTIEGAVLRPLTFRPSFHKHAAKNCGGLQVHVTDDARFEPYRAYVRLLSAIARHHRAELAWRTERYEFIDHIPAIDLLTGGAEIRETIDRGADVEAILDGEREALARFGELRRPWLLYAR